MSWSASVGESAKNTIKSLLDSLDPSDPILLLAVAEEPFSEIPHDIKSWFGFLRNNRVTLEQPDNVGYLIFLGSSVAFDERLILPYIQEQRKAFFDETLSSIARKPTEYPDAMPRKKRVLEELALAAPLPPREPTAAELEAQAQNDARIREYLKFRLGPVIAELRKRNKKFCKPIGDGEEIQIVSPVNPEHPPNEIEDNGQKKDLPVGGNEAAVNGHNGDVQAPNGENGPAANDQGNTLPGDAMDTMDEATMVQPDTTQPMLATTSTETGAEGQMQEQAQLAIPMAANPLSNREVFLTFRFHDISLDKVHERLFADRYHTPEMMLADIQRIVENAYHEGDPDTLSKADQMLNYARIMCDQACDPAFRVECQRMAQREKDRAKKRAQLRQKAREEAAAEAGKRELAAVAQTEELEDSTTSKRAREDGEDEPSNEQAKRARFTEDVVMADSPTRAGPSSQSLMPPTPSVPAASTSEIAAVVPSPTMAEPVPSKEATPPPAEPLPDFILPEATLQDLGRFLVSHTGALTVDELEQLRAACYDCIWRARRNWDKSNVIDEIRELAEEYITELEESKKNDS